MKVAMLRHSIPKRKMVNEMTKKEFISEVAKYVQELAPKYGIKVCSPIIGQACLESSYGTSDKAKYFNLFGLKYRENRVPIASGTFTDKSKEQKKDGSWIDIETKWFKFKDMKDGVEGYFQFTNISNYANLKGVTDPKKYLDNLIADKYATDLKYVDKVMNVIKEYDLTQYDNVSDVSDTKVKFNIHAGHGLDGKVACGAVGLIKESTENRKVCAEVVRLLNEAGYTAYDCTVDDGTSQSDVLNKIKAKSIAHTVDYNVSIHFNSGANDKSGDGKSKGVEVLLHDSSSKAKSLADKVLKNIVGLGYKDRGIKYSTGLYVLNNLKNCMLIECCFVDDKDDVKLYDYKTMAKAIAEGLIGKTISSTSTSSSTTSTTFTSKKVNPYKEPTVNVKNGSKGESVKWLQYELNEEGNKLTVDGIFGSKTLSALKTFQKKAKLTVDGICGKNTRAALKK